VRLRIAPNLLTIFCRLAKQYYPDANITVDVQLSLLEQDMEFYSKTN